MGKVIMNQMIEKLKDPRGVEKDLVIKQTGNKMSEKDYDNLENLMYITKVETNLLRKFKLIVLAYASSNALRKGVGMIRVDFGPISETVYIDIILNTITER